MVESPTGHLPTAFVPLFCYCRYWTWQLVEFGKHRLWVTKVGSNSWTDGRVNILYLKLWADSRLFTSYICWNANFRVLSKLSFAYWLQIWSYFCSTFNFFLFFSCQVVAGNNDLKLDMLLIYTMQILFAFKFVGSEALYFTSASWFSFFCADRSIWEIGSWSRRYTRWSSRRVCWVSE